MINKKVCMLGSFAVGKTSLVQQYVYSIFSDTYLSTVGVKISKKQIKAHGVDINLVLWDLEGQDENMTMNKAYLRGAMGVLLVVDGTRAETMQTALVLRQTMLDTVGNIPHLILLNKSDLEKSWEISKSDLHKLDNAGIPYLKTSAMNGENVDQAFFTLTEAMLDK